MAEIEDRVDAEASAQLAKFREQSGMSFERMAKSLRIEPGRLALMEDGQRPVPRQTLFAAGFLRDNPDRRLPSTDEAPTGGFISDEFAAWLSEPPLRDGQEWGPWRFDMKNASLDLDSRIVVVDRDENGDVLDRRESYAIPLFDMTDLKAVLRWQCHIVEKPWGASTLGWFVRAIDDIIGWQTLAHGNLQLENAEGVARHLLDRCKSQDQHAANQSA